MESVNPATERMLGHAAGRNVSLLMPEPFRGEHDGYISNYLRTGQAKIIGATREVPALRRDGSVFPTELSVSEMRVGGRRLFTGIHRDLTDPRRLEQKVAVRIEGAGGF